MSFGDYYRDSRLRSESRLLVSRRHVCSIKPLRRLLVKCYTICGYLPLLVVLGLLVSLFGQLARYKPSFLVKTCLEERVELNRENDRIITNASTAALFQERLNTIPFAKEFNVAELIRIVRHIDAIGDGNRGSRMTGSRGYIDTINYVVSYLLKHALAQPKIENFNIVPFLQVGNYGILELFNDKNEQVKELYFGKDFIVHSSSSIYVQNAPVDVLNLPFGFKTLSLTSCRGRGLYFTLNNAHFDGKRGELDLLLHLLQEVPKNKFCIIYVSSFDNLLRKLPSGISVPLIFLKTKLTGHKYSVGIEYDAGKATMIETMGSNISCVLAGKSDKYILLTARLDSLGASNSPNYSVTGIAVLLSIMQTFKRTNKIPEHNLVFYFVSGDSYDNCGSNEAYAALKGKSIYNNIIMHLDAHTLATTGCIPLLVHSKDRFGNEMGKYFSRLFSSNDIMNESIALNRYEHPFGKLVVSCTRNNKNDVYSKVSKNALIAVSDLI